MAGRTFGEFTLVSQVGMGGFGDIYAAHQESLNREAIVKVLRANRLATPQKHQFIQEALLASQLRHPYAAHIYSFGTEDDGLLWIAMELVDGIPLNKWLVNNGPMELEQCLPIVENLCEVLQEAHDKGIIHCDIKPSNVMIIEQGDKLRPKLLDFGIARSLHETPTQRAASTRDVQTQLLLSAEDSEQTSDTRQLLGTPYYAAPEQWRHGVVDARTDIYSLGAVVYQMLTASILFDGKTTMDIRRAHLQGTQVALDASFPAPIAETLRIAVSKNPDNRFRSASELFQALREAAGIAPTRSITTISPALKHALLTDAPEPIAEVVSALDASASLSDVISTASRLVDTVARYVGVVALTCRSHTGASDDGDSPRAQRLLARLRQRELTTTEWWDLARELTRRFRSIPTAYPIGALVYALHDNPTTGIDIEPLCLTQDLQVAENVEILLQRLEAISQWLQGLSFLMSYRLVVRRGRFIESWMGLRRTSRAFVDAHIRLLNDGQPTLIDETGTAVLELSPLIEIARPAPHAEYEIFMLAGRGTRGQKMTAGLRDYVRHNPAIDAWFNEFLRVSDGPLETESDENSRPYKGLASFGPQDAERFFGREREAEAFVNRMLRDNILAVVGPSGSGKSSFVQAGVLPLFPRATTIIMRPGADALSSATRACEPYAPINFDNQAEGVLANLLRMTQMSTGEPVLFVIDQFEELFTICSKQSRTRFAQELGKIADNSHNDVYVIITLRDDFLAHAEELPTLRGRVAGAMQFLVTPNREDLHRILVLPAKQEGYNFENDSLLDAMIEEVAERPGALPLLSFTANQLWNLRDRKLRLLTRRSYDSIGGVGGALAKHADDTLDGMSKAGRELTRETFRHLLTHKGTRDVMSRAELEDVLGNNQDSIDTIEALLGARLLTSSDESDRIEIIHEALVTAWPTLVGWQKQDAEIARLKDQLRASARQWRDAHKSKALLWRGDVLLEFTVWQKRYTGRLTRLESEFITASQHEASKVRRLKAGALLTALAVSIVLAIVFWRLRGDAEQARVEADRQAKSSYASLTQSYIEAGRQALVNDDDTTALAYLAAAKNRGAQSKSLDFMLAQSVQTLRAHTGTLSGHAGNIVHLKFSHDGDSLVSADKNGEVRVWDANNYSLRFTLDGHKSLGGAPVFSPDGHYLATSGGEGTVRLWNLNDGKLVHTVGRAGCLVSLWNPTVFDTQALHTAIFCEGHLEIWRLPSATLVARHEVPSENQIRQRLVYDYDASQNTLVFSLGGKSFYQLQDLTSPPKKVATQFYTVLLATRDGNTITTIENRISLYRDNQLVSSWTAGPGWITAIRFSPDGKTLTSTDIDNAVATSWSAQTGQLLSRFRGRDGFLSNIDYSADGQYLLGAGTDGSTSLWQASTGQKLATLWGKAGRAWTAAIENNNRLIATASGDEIRIWRTASLALPIVEPRFVPHIALTDDSLRTLDYDGQLRERSILTRDSRSHTHPGHFVALSSDGRLAVQTVAEQNQLYDLRTKTSRFSFPKPATDFWFTADDAQVFACQGAQFARFAAHSGAAQTIHSGLPCAPQTAAAGNILLSHQRSGALRLVDMPTGETHRVLLNHTDGVNASAFARDRSKLVVADNDASARVWRISPDSTVSPPTTLTGHQGVIGDATFIDNDNNFVATVSWDRTLRIWDAATGDELLRRELSAPGQQLAATTLGTRIAVSSAKDISVWDLATEVPTAIQLNKLLRCSGRVVMTEGQFAAVSGCQGPHIFAVE